MDASDPTPGSVAPDLSAVKSRQQTTWATGDFSRLATQIHFTAEHLAQTADLQAGWRVLDVATGSGNAAIAAARLGCEATGVDYVPALLERGRERAAVERLEVDFRVGDAEALPFPDGSFDAVLSIYGAMFAPDHRRAASELLRVTRPGGRIAMGNWTPDSFVGDMFKTVAGHAPPPPGLEPPILWGTEKHLRELFGDAVSELRIDRREFVFRYRSDVEFVEIFRTWFGPVIKAFEAVGAAGAPALENDLLDLVGRWNRNEGGEHTAIAMPSAYLEVVATRI
jgi:ubiquinone/menaquinone biosynthesis C-methylase UbiE